MRGRIRSLAQSTSPTQLRSRPTARAVAAVTRRRPEPVDRRSAEPLAGGDTFEWDMRKSDGPTDSALYDCVCGCQFTAPVATSVSCPNCGAGQAW